MVEIENNKKYIISNNTIKDSGNPTRLERYLKKNSVSSVLDSLRVQPVIPLCVFATDLGPFETIVKYLKENYNLRYCEIASILNRDDRSIWSAYSVASKKLPGTFTIRTEQLEIPARIFSDRNFSILEILCDYLRNLGLSISQIASLLSKHRNTIGSVLRRHKEKSEDFAKKNARVKTNVLLKGISNSRILESLRSKPVIPLCVFANELGPFEAIVKYLKDNRRLRYCEIASILNRDDRSIWSAYSVASKKLPGTFTIRKGQIEVPAQIFADRKFSVLETLCSYLQNLGLSTSQIAHLLKKHQSTIGTELRRHKKKDEA